MARSHENPESEQVIQENERFAVTKTVTGEATKLARGSDRGASSMCLEIFWLAKERPNAAVPEPPSDRRNKKHR